MQCAEHSHSLSLLRISASDHANVTQFFPCINHVSVPPYISEIAPILQPHRKKSRLPSYTSLTCAPPKKNLCFRGVYDGFDYFINDAHKVIVNQQGQARPGDDLYDRFALLLENLILHKNATLPAVEEQTKPILLEPSVRRQRTYVKSKDMGNFEELHADYFESAGFVYSAILYDDTPEDLIGGETALVDFAESLSAGAEFSFGLNIRGNKTHTAVHSKLINRIKLPPLEFTSGMMIEPKRGRLVVFSSDGSNFHAPLEVKQGRRSTYHIWYKCKMNALD